MTIENAIGDKVALLLNLIGITVAGVALAIWYRWTFALFLVGIAPFGAFVLVLFILFAKKKRMA